MSGVPFAVSDLVVADVPQQAAGGLRPTVEARLTKGQLAAYMELYSDQPNYFGTVQVRVEVARTCRARRWRPRSASSSRERTPETPAFPRWCRLERSRPGNTWPTRLSDAAIRRSAS